MRQLKKKSEFCCSDSKISSKESLQEKSYGQNSMVEFEIGEID
jgi:hypothetical protein